MKSILKRLGVNVSTADPKTRYIEAIVGRFDEFDNRLLEDVNSSPTRASMKFVKDGLSERGNLLPPENEQEVEDAQDELFRNGVYVSKQSVKGVVHIGKKILKRSVLNDHAEPIFNGVGAHDHDKGDCLDKDGVSCDRLTCAVKEGDAELTYSKMGAPGTFQTRPREIENFLKAVGVEDTNAMVASKSPQFFLSAYESKNCFATLSHRCSQTLEKFAPNVGSHR